MRFLKVVIILNVLVASGFAVAGVMNPALVVPADQMHSAPRILALYAAARAIPLAVATVMVVLANTGDRKPMGLGASRRTPLSSGRSTLITLAMLAASIQLADGFIGVYLGEPSKYVGPFVLAVLTFWGVRAAKAAQ